MPRQATLQHVRLGGLSPTLVTPFKSELPDKVCFTSTSTRQHACRCPSVLFGDCAHSTRCTRQVSGGRVGTPSNAHLQRARTLRQNPRRTPPRPQPHNQASLRPTTGVLPPHHSTSPANFHTVPRDVHRIQHLYLTTRHTENCSSQTLLALVNSGSPSATRCTHHPYTARTRPGFRVLPSHEVMSRVAKTPWNDACLCHTTQCVSQRVHFTLNVHPLQLVPQWSQMHRRFFSNLVYFL